MTNEIISVEEAIETIKHSGRIEYERGYQDGQKIILNKIYKYIVQECNPYGNPTISYEDGIKILDYLDKIKGIKSNDYI